MCSLLVIRMCVSVVLLFLFFYYLFCLFNISFLKSYAKMLFILLVLKKQTNKKQSLVSPIFSIDFSVSFISSLIFIIFFPSDTTLFFFF